MRKNQKQYQPEGTAYQLRGIPPELWKKMRVYAAEHDSNLREVVLFALTRFLEMKY